jgi:hypothetical protein
MRYRLGKLLQRLSIRLLGYNETDYGRGFADGFRAGADEAVRQETIDELIASVQGGA